jgi:hypothetical protein
MVKTAIVTTTIFVPTALERYFRNVCKHGHQDTLFVITGDKKTPKEAKPFVAEKAAEFSINAVFMDVDDQVEYMKKFPELDAVLPWNCIQRRNVSILYAYEQGADIIITIDDDNLCGDDSDYVGEHLRSFQAGEKMPALKSSSGWLNVCQYLRDKRGFNFYPRGYPMDQRWPQYEPAISSRTSDRRVVVNAGLWLDDPDVDAITRLCNDISAVQYTREDNFTLDKGTWCPYNSQNTAMHRDLVEGYILSAGVGRMDDIWAGYVTLAIMDHLGDTVCFGHPLVTQERNPHNFFRDHEKESVGLEASSNFCKVLRTIPLTCTNYIEGIDQITEGLVAAIAEGKFPGASQGHVEEVIKALRAWSATIKRIKG